MKMTATLPGLSDELARAATLPIPNGYHRGRRWNYVRILQFDSNPAALRLTLS
jgi:hypothetical protein